MMRYVKARELIAAITWELDVGEGASGFDWSKARERAQQLLNLFDSALHTSK